MSKTVTSNSITFIDLTDSRKLDAYITSNLPITQIYNQNTQTYTPDWSTTNLQLNADIYLDSKDVTSNDYTSIIWYKKVGTQSKEQVGTGAKLIINGNQLTTNNTIITYICEATYKDTTSNPPTAHAEITFARVDTGLNGSNGVDGTGVTILGSYNTLTELQTSHPTGNAGDAYIVDGDLYVWAIDDSQWENVGNIQGPAGKDGINAKNIILTGDSQVFKVSKTNTVTPSIIKVTAQAFNTTATNWTYSINGGQTFLSTAPTGVSRNGNIVTITGSTITSNSIVIKASDGEVEDVFTVYKAIDGVDGSKGDNGAPAPIVFLTNENVTFSANAQGQISGTTIISKVVAYNGIDKVMPILRKNTDGTPAITGAPNGMSITTSEITASNEIMLTITVANNSTLGSALNNMGTISIPVTSPANTVLTLIWSKVNSGAMGVGIKSTTVTYGVSDSASVKPADTAWQSAIPTVEEGKYLWTRTIIDYTDDAMADTVTYTYAKQGVKGDTGSTGSSVTVSSIQYQESTSATIPPNNTWSNSVVTVAEGKFLWTKTTFSDGKIAYGVAKQGASGRGISSITEYYLATADASGVTASTSGWTSTVQTIDVTKKYLWNYELITYTDNTISATTPIIIGVFGNTGAAGKGIKSVTEYYLATSSSSGVTTSTTGWTTTIQTLTATNKYLWNYELITYTDNTTTTINPVIIGVYGDKGDKGSQGDKGSDAYTVILTNESHIFAGNISSAIAASATTQVLAYKGSASQSVTIVSVDGKTASTSSTATSIAGLSFACSALSGTSPTITFTCTASFVSPSGTIPIVLMVDGVTIIKMFTYSIAFKGATGAQGSVGTAASLVDITPSALYFKSTTGNNGTFTPDYIYLYPRFQTVTYSKWEYSVDGGTTWAAASGANGLTISTYNSVANTLRIAKGSTLYTNTVTSISFRCVSSNASVYDTVSIAKIYDVVDLQIGGRNLLTNSGYMTNLNGWTVYSSNYPVNDLKLEANDIYGSVLTATGTAASSRIRVGQYIPYLQKANRTLTFSMIYQASADNASVTAGGKYSENDNSGEYGSFSGTNIKRTDLGNGFTYMETTFNLTYTEATRSFFVYIYPGIQTTKIVYCKLEEGNKATTGWSSAPEDLKTFQLYAPKGYLITKDVPEVTLQTFAYEGSIAITNATFKWYSRSGDNWTVISGATNDSFVVNKSDVLKSNVYKCEMTYRGVKYEATATIEDKTDIYESVMCISSNTRGNNCYWVLYTLVYTDAKEIDPLLGPISINAPSSPVNGDYWYAVDETNASVRLKKYNGTSWANSTDTQSLSYYWDIINNGSEKVPFGDHSKVQVVSCNDFTATATLVCGVNNVEDGLLTQSSLSLTDASDPIVSATEPSSVVDGQIWIKPNNNGTYIMSVWDATNRMWVVSDMDTRTKVHTSKPSTYNVGDLWITASDTEHSDYLEGTLLMANTSSSTFSEDHWFTTLKYDKDLDSIKKTLNNLSQYVNITSEGLKIGAQSASGELSPFTSLFTSTELAFYQNSDKLLTLANNQLTAPHIVVEDDLEVGKTISLSNLNLTIETNGSFSFAVTK